MRFFTLRDTALKHYQLSSVTRPGKTLTQVSYGVGGNAEVKNEYDANLWPVSGSVGRAGGLDGFVLPIIFATRVNLNGVATTV